MPSSCKDIRKFPCKSPLHPRRARQQLPFSRPSTGAALAACLQNSDCIMVQRNSPSDCLRPPLSQTLPTRCQQLQKGYAECKRGMVDMRKRFRGNRPVGASKEIEGEDNDEGLYGRMLYAGRPAGGSGVKATDGKEDGAEKRE